MKQPHIVKAFDVEIDKLNHMLIAMASACEKQLNMATQAFGNLDIQLAKQVVTADDHINLFQKKIEDTSVKLLALRQPMAADLRYLLSAMRIASELERIGDYAANIAKRVTLLSKTTSHKPVKLIIEMATLCQKMLTAAMDAFLTIDIEKAIAVWQQDNDIDKKFAGMMTLIQKQMQENPTAIDDGTQLIFIGRCCERIGDHITNIAEDIYYMETGNTQQF